MGENVVIDNLDIFKMNGFQFEIDHEGTVSKARPLMGDLQLICGNNNSLAMPTKRVKLVGQPVSKNWSLGPKGSSNIVCSFEHLTLCFLPDIDELIFMLSDGSCSSVSASVIVIFYPLIVPQCTLSERSDKAISSEGYVCFKGM